MVVWLAVLDVLRMMSVVAYRVLSLSLVPATQDHVLQECRGEVDLLRCTAVEGDAQ